MRSEIPTNDFRKLSHCIAIVRERGRVRTSTTMPISEAVEQVDKFADRRVEWQW